MEYVQVDKKPINIIVIGWSVDDAKLKSNSSCIITGKYKDEDFHALLENHKIDCALFLSQWPETYSYTLSLAFKHQIFPFVLDIGAQAERVKKTGFGCVLENDQPNYIVSEILRVIQEE